MERPNLQLKTCTFFSRSPQIVKLCNHRHFSSTGTPEVHSWTSLLLSNRGIGDYANTPTSNGNMHFFQPVALEYKIMPLCNHNSFAIQWTAKVIKLCIICHAAHHQLSRAELLQYCAWSTSVHAHTGTCANAHITHDLDTCMRAHIHIHTHWEENSNVNGCSLKSRIAPREKAMSSHAVS